MRNAMLMALVLCGIWSATATPKAQLPVPSALLEHRVVFLTGKDVKRGWLSWAADEIQNFDRFKLVGDREDAELVFTLIYSKSSEGTAVLPLTGVGIIAVPIGQQGFTLVVQDEMGKVLWNDSREVNWLGVAQSRT